MPIPRLPLLFCAASGDELAVSFDQRSVVTLADPDGRVRQLLEVLSEGSRTPDAIASELGAPLAEVAEAIGNLDELGWLEDGAADAGLDAEVRERHYSSLAFLDMFSSLTRSSASMQRKVFDAHVAVLGVGGLGRRSHPASRRTRCETTDAARFRPGGPAELRAADSPIPRPSSGCPRLSKWRPGSPRSSRGRRCARCIGGSPARTWWPVSSATWICSSRRWTRRPRWTCG